VAKVVAINISEKKGTIKNPIDEGNFIKELGLEGDAHGGNWHRMVSLLAQESIDKMIKAGVDNLKPGMFAENITTEGIELHKLPIGTKLKIGDTIQEVTQIGKECHTGCAIKTQVGKCIMPREGIFTKIIKEVKVRPGYIIELINDN
jgi:MOSC domain-containing protein YiiM